MDNREFEATLHELDKRVDRLRALYEQYFRGYERIEPIVPRKDVERRLFGLRTLQPRNTASRFRYQQLLQRYTMFTTRWGRLTRQIEEGTHPWVLERLRRRKRRAAPVARVRERDLEEFPSVELDLDQELSLDELLSEAALDEVASAVDKPGAHRVTLPPTSVAVFGAPGSGRPSSRPRTISRAVLDLPDDDTGSTGRHEPVRLPSQRVPRVDASEGPRAATPGGSLPRPAPSVPRASAARTFGKPVPVGTPQTSGPLPTPARDGMDESRVRAIYERFVEARRANNEPSVRYETVAKRIDAMLPELRKKHGDRAIVLAREAGDVSTEFWARWGLGVLSGMRGGADHMREAVDERTELADRARAPIL